MSKHLKKLAYSLLLGMILLGRSVAPVSARNQCTQAIRSSFSMSGMPSPIYSNSQLAPVTVTFSGLTPGTNYSAFCYSLDCNPFCGDNLIANTQYNFTADANGNGTWNIQNNNCWSGRDDFQVVLNYPGEGDCDVGDDIQVRNANDSIRIQNTSVTAGSAVYCVGPGTRLDWEVQVVYADGRPYDGGDDIVVISGEVVGGMIGGSRAERVDSSGYRRGSDQVINDAEQTDFGEQVSYSVYRGFVSTDRHLGTFTGPVIQAQCTEEEETTPPPTDGDTGSQDTGDSQAYTLCSANLIPGTAAHSACVACGGEDGKQGIWTAVGCIPQRTEPLITKIISIGIGILGGIFLLRVLAAAFTLTISQGDVKKTSEAKEMITESVIGVLFVLFSVTILQFIGAGVLKIPGFGS